MAPHRKAAAGGKARQIRLGKAQVPVPHGLLVTRAIVACHVHHQECPARSETGRKRAQHGCRIVHVMDHEHEDAEVRLARRKRRREQVALAELHVRETRQSLARGGEHRRLAVERDDLAHHGREPLGGLAGAAADVHRHRVGRQQAKECLGDERIAEELAAQLVPVAADAAEEGAAVHAARRQHLGQACIVLVEGCGAPEMVTAHAPEFAHVRGQCGRHHAIEALRALGALGHPALLEERLQVAAHRALRQLQRARQFAHAQFLALQETQHAQARHVPERAQPAQPAFPGIRGIRGHGPSGSAVSLLRLTLCSASASAMRGSFGRMP